MVLVAVHVRYAPLAAAYLSEYRLQKAQNCKLVDDRARSVCAGLALDACLRTVGLSEREVTVGIDRNGKPVLQSHPQWQFSLSHSGEYGVCGLDDAPIGVDVEQLRPLDTVRLGERHFGKQLNRPDFFNAWTRQESYVKAIGKGLAALNETPPPLWHFHTYSLPEHVLTVCSQKTEFSPLTFFSADGSVPPR